jgi:endonuclease/exonuclease/phosphatase family metal-dependent hydrolase
MKKTIAISPITFVLLSLISFGASASEVKNLGDDLATFHKQDKSKRDSLLQECKNNKKYLNLDYRVICENNYHHYNSSAYSKNYSRAKAMEKENVRISEYNALHPGMKKTRFKDYHYTAKLLNEFDLIGVTELLPLIGPDKKNNAAAVSFLKDGPKQYKKFRAELKDLKAQQRKKRRKSVVLKRKIILLESVIKRMRKDLKLAKDLYRQPGYLKILTALHRLPGGKDWALILSPRGEGAATSHTKELVGYYYRSSVVKPMTNKYCEKVRRFGKATPVACMVNMSAQDLGEDKSNVFSRRPFMANFISGKFSFTLLTSHVIFDSPKDKKLMREIVHSAFGVEHYKDLGSRVGIQKGNYARFAEVDVILEFIQKYTKENKTADVIYMGDLNLETNNKFWPRVLSTWEGSKLYITGKTSTNEARYRSGNIPTNGVTSNYDHFIFNPKRTKECINDEGKITGGALNFQKGNFAKIINREYRVRKENSHRDGSYRVSPTKYQRLIKKYSTPYLRGDKQQFTMGSVKHVYRDTRKEHPRTEIGVVSDSSDNVLQADLFIERVLDSQLNDHSYYYMYEQLLSDHLPIYMDCKTN